MKDQKVSYKIKRPNYEKELEITISIQEIEKSGLVDYLYHNGLIGENDSIQVINRFIIPVREEKKDIKSNFKNYRGRFDYGSSNFEPKNFRVHLYSIDFFKNDSKYPKFVDVVATTKGKSLMKAMNKVGLTEFPINWTSLEVIVNDDIENFGQYILDDENNPFIKKIKREREQYYKS